MFLLREPFALHGMCNILEGTSPLPTCPHADRATTAAVTQVVSEQYSEGLYSHETIRAEKKRKDTTLRASEEQQQ